MRNVVVIDDYIIYQEGHTPINLKGMVLQLVNWPLFSTHCTVNFRDEKRFLNKKAVKEVR